MRTTIESYWSRARILAALLPAAFPLHGAEESAKAIRALQPFVDNQTLAGAIVLVADRDKVLDVRTLGYSDLAAKKAMRADAVFWIASMSKAITAAGLMILVDDGRVKIDDDVEKFLPEFKDSMVVAERDDRHTLLRPAQNRIKVKHLLAHTSGLIFKSALESGALDQRPLSERVVSYAYTPLLFEPGTKYLYSNAGINTAARIIEVVSNLAFEDFMDRRLLRPLGMKDTTFWPNTKQIARMPKAYKPNKENNGLEETISWQLTFPLDDRKRQPMPGGGYFSTAADIANFCRMLINGGALAGQRVLSEDSVRIMTTEQSGRVPILDNKGHDSSYGFGLVFNAPGRFWHNAALGTHMWMDASRGLAVVFMVQHAGYPNDGRKKVNETVIRETLGKFEK